MFYGNFISTVSLIIVYFQLYFFQSSTFTYFQCCIVLTDSLVHVLILDSKAFYGVKFSKK